MAVEMDGIRSWKFETGGDTLELIETDFWINYEAATQGTGQPELSLVLNSIWQHSDFALTPGIKRRKFIEDRLKELKWDFVGKKGTLTIDESTPEEVILTDITLLGVDTETGDFNELMEYAMTFGFPLTSASGIGGEEVARAIRFTKLPHNFINKTQEMEAWTAIAAINVISDLDTAPDGTMTLDEVQDTDVSAAAHIERTSAFNGELFQFEYAIRVKKTTLAPSFPAVVAEIKSITTLSSGYIINTDLGTLILASGSTAADSAVIITDPQDSNFWLVLLRITNTDANNTILLLRIFPAANSDGGNSIFTVTLGAIRVWGTQISIADIAGFPNGVDYVARNAQTPDVIADVFLDFTSDNYIVQRNKEDRTVMKDVFRAAPIRVRGQPGLETINVQGIKQTTVTEPPDDTTLERRQTAELLVQKWVDFIGDKGRLLIDQGDTNELSFIASLTDASPSDLSLPDAVTFDLEFFSGFVE